jgi:uncharacterized protein
MAQSSPDKKIPMKTLAKIKDIIKKNRKTLADRYKVSRIGLFGSYVRGDTTSRSDLDVLVEFSEPISLLTLVALENYLSRTIGIKVDVVPKENIRTELRENILHEAVYV